MSIFRSRYDIEGLTAKKAIFDLDERLTVLSKFFFKCEKLNPLKHRVELLEAEVSLLRKEIEDVNKRR